MHPIIIVILTFLLGYYLLKLVRFSMKMKRFMEFGKHLPGPPAVPILGNSLALGTLEGPKVKNFYITEMNKLVAQGESIMRLWLGHHLFVVPLDGNTLKDIVESQTEIKKGRDYDFVLPWLGTGLLISTGEKWKSRRKLLTPTFHFSMLDGYVQVFDKQCRTLVSVLEAHENKIVDVFPIIKRCALDIICETAMGTTLNAQRDENQPYVVAVTEMGTLSRDYAMKPWLWLPPVWYLGGYHSDYTKKLNILTEFTKNVIKEREEKYRTRDKSILKTGRKAFLDMLIEMKETSNFNSEDIREEVDTFMFEGHDTTSAGTGWILWCIACHPEVQQKVAQELFDVFGESNRSITVEDIKQLTYLELVIKEAMRIHPPVPIVSRVLNNDLQMGKYALPAGCQILIMPLVVHNNEKIWPNSNEFDPDRFLPENSKGRHAYDYIPFSAGPRNCIGQKFAVYEEKAMVSWIIRRFHVKPTRPFMENVACPEIILKPQHGIPLILKKRDWNLL